MRGRKNGYTYNTKKNRMCLHNSLFPDLKSIFITPLHASIGFSMMGMSRSSGVHKDAFEIREWDVEQKVDSLLCPLTLKQIETFSTFSQLPPLSIWYFNAVQNECCRLPLIWICIESSN